MQPNSTVVESWLRNVKVSGSILGKVWDFYNDVWTHIGGSPTFTSDIKKRTSTLIMHFIELYVLHSDVGYQGRN
jgi:hypothetical protein